MQIIDSFELSAKKPLDARQMWDSLADLEANVATLMPVGFLAYCKAEGEWYQLKSATDESDPTTYVWQLMQSSSVAIQVKSLPVIKEGEEDKLTEWASNTFYQFAGATNAEYTYGHFYKLDTIAMPKVLETLPVDNVAALLPPEIGFVHSLEGMKGMIVAYTNNDNVTKNYILTGEMNSNEPYTWEETSETPEKYYNWREVSVQDNNGQVIQVGTADVPVPPAAVINEGRIVQYVGTTNSTMRTGYFYRCTNQAFYAYKDEDDSAPVTVVYVNENPITKTSKLFLKNGDSFEEFSYTYTTISAVMEDGKLNITYSDGSNEYEDTFEALPASDETVYFWKEIDTQAAGEDREALLKSDLVASVSVGGVEAGDTIKEDAPLETILRRILSPATPPEFTFTGTPAAGLYEIGTAVATPQLALVVTKLGSNSSRKYKIVKPADSTEEQVETGTLVLTEGTYYSTNINTSDLENNTLYGDWKITSSTNLSFIKKLFENELVSDSSVTVESSNSDISVVTSSSSLQVQDSPTTAEQGKEVTITFKKTTIVTVPGGSSTDVVPDTPLELTTYSHTTEDNITTNFTYTAVVSYADDDNNVKTVSKNVAYEFVHASYHGIVDTATPDDTTVSALTKTLSKTANFNWTGINMTNQRACYAYPASYGAITKITDENNFNVTSSFNVIDMEINSVAYKVYVTKDTATLVSGKLVFEK